MEVFSNKKRFIPSANKERFGGRSSNVTSVLFGRGFTLIETLIAIFVLTCGIVAVLQMFPLSVQVETSAKMTSVASQLGQEKIEELRSQAYNDITCATTTEAYGTISGFSGYKRVTMVNYVYPTAGGLQATTTDQGLKRVETMVYWESTLGSSEKNIKIATLISGR